MFKVDVMVKKIINAHNIYVCTLYVNYDCNWIFYVLYVSHLFGHLKRRIRIKYLETLLKYFWVKNKKCKSFVGHDYNWIINISI